MTSRNSAGTERHHEIYRIYRDRIVQEDNIINMRVTWMLWSQAILLATWAAIAAAIANSEFVHTYAVRFTGSAVLVLLAAFGLALSWSNRFSLSAAEDEIKCLCTAYIGLCRDIEIDQALPGLVGSEDHHWKGHFVQRGMPGFFIALWLALLLCSTIWVTAAVPATF